MWRWKRFFDGEKIKVISDPGGATGDSTALIGGCHCGGITLTFHTAAEPADITPRACDCSFCAKHGAQYISDPSGRLHLEAKGREPLGRYRQGSRSVDFLFCRGCGILVAVVHERDGAIYGAVNARCLNEEAALGKPEAMSPQKLSASEKINRWTRLWIPDVRITVSDA